MSSKQASQQLNGQCAVNSTTFGPSEETEEPVGQSSKPTLVRKQEVPGTEPGTPIAEGWPRLTSTPSSSENPSKEQSASPQSQDGDEKRERSFSHLFHTPQKINRADSAPPATTPDLGGKSDIQGSESRVRQYNDVFVSDSAVEFIVQDNGPPKLFSSRDSFNGSVVRLEPSMSQDTDQGPLDASDRDSDVEEAESGPPLSHEAVTTEVTAKQVDMPDEQEGAVSVMLLVRDYPVLTQDRGTVLRVIRTDKDGKFLRNDDEELVTISFPSTSTVIREEH